MVLLIRIWCDMDIMLSFLSVTLYWDWLGGIDKLISFQTKSLSVSIRTLFIKWITGHYTMIWNILELKNGIQNHIPSHKTGILLRFLTTEFAIASVNILSCFYVLFVWKWFILITHIISLRVKINWIIYKRMFGRSKSNFNYSYEVGLRAHWLGNLAAWSHSYVWIVHERLFVGCVFRLEIF